MLNFLPQNNKNKIIIEYILRVNIYLFLFVFLSCIILITLFIPSYFFTKYKNDNISNQLSTAKQTNINKGDDPVIFIKNTNRLSIALSSNNISAVAYSDIVNKIVSLKNKDIKIDSIIIKENDANLRTISISGVANTRDSLTLFNNNIVIDGFFKSVVFPVSNFIKSSNSEFSATLTI